MKFHGGHTPRISGRPLSVVEEVPLPGQLLISLTRGGFRYTSTVRQGQRVSFGDPLAEVPVSGGTLRIPAPAAGKIAEAGDDTGVVVLQELSRETSPSRFAPHKPERISAKEMREILSSAGIWPFFWSTRTGGLPVIGDDEKPKAIVVNCVLAEPFKARGKVIIRRAWSRILQGIRFVPRLLEDYGRVEIILTAARDPVARQMYRDLAGDAWVRLHAVSVTYPIENPRVMISALRKAVPSYRKDDVLWTIDVQGMEALGACLAEGLPLHQRVVATGGPAALKPRHHSVRIGTPLRSFAAAEVDGERVRILRGGLLTGAPVTQRDDSVGPDDDGFFYLPEAPARQFLAFLRPGFDRASYLPCFATVATGGPDRAISTLMRGERRPCIACGLCEKVCPTGIMPQVLHRYLYRDALEQAEKAGLERCVGCELCTFVCPSKIELKQQFEQSMRRIRAERAEERAAPSSSRAGAPSAGGSAA